LRRDVSHLQGYVLLFLSQRLGLGRSLAIGIIYQVYIKLNSGISRKELDPAERLRYRGPTKWAMYIAFDQYLIVTP
jgi:hypothetical protein